MENETKKCSKCQNIKSLNDFGVDNKKKSGLKSYCKLCRKTEFNKEKDQERKKEWYLKIEN